MSIMKKIHDIEGGRLQLSPVIQDDLISTAAFFSAAIDSIISNQTWFAPIGKNESLVEEWWIGTEVVKAIKALLQNESCNIAWVGEIFTERFYTLVAGEEYNVMFNKRHLRILHEVQNAITKSPKVHCKNVLQDFNLKWIPTVESEASHPSHQQLA